MIYEYSNIDFPQSENINAKGAEADFFTLFDFSAKYDPVPAMLTPGEFVMSKDAVQKWGVNTLEGMNAAGGGTNIPLFGRYSGGGFATCTDEGDKNHWKTQCKNEGGQKIIAKRHEKMRSTFGRASAWMC